jgi:hypothetical protein
MLAGLYLYQVSARYQTAPPSSMAGPYHNLQNEANAYRRTVTPITIVPASVRTTTW